ncbi:hypothetical protein HPB51_003372 [Rhipicephalus microplus]|uniref:MULE transposase domain-containing protein n=1 Tax=Rhipicephalus microplus TaxID=6941 RepID=A0A9J6D3U9_RHIMP|nr:hypothetical protein HPB51_003372 [Rhipicephalus microplus]
MRHHEAVLGSQPDGPLLLANGSMNPLKRTVYWWHEEWRVDKYGPPGNPICGKAAEGSHICSCCAPRGSSHAQDVIFVDSTSSCDTEGNTATVLLTATKAGAVPVAVVLHSSQTRDCYRAASQLLKEKYPTCFGNNQAPAAFMSDNSRPEKDALRDVWPSSKQLLFIFHVLQAEWCWLMSAPSLGKEDRRNLITSFQKRNGLSATLPGFRGDRLCARALRALATFGVIVALADWAGPTSPPVAGCLR